MVLHQNIWHKAQAFLTSSWVILLPQWRWRMTAVLYLFGQRVIPRLALFTSCRQKRCRQMGMLCPAWEHLAKEKEDEIKICTLAQGCVDQRKGCLFLFLFSNLHKCLLCSLVAHKATSAGNGHLFLIYTRTLCDWQCPTCRSIYKAHGTSIMGKLFVSSPVVPHRSLKLIICGIKIKMRTIY